MCVCVKTQCSTVSSPRQKRQKRDKVEVKAVSDLLDPAPQVVVVGQAHRQEEQPTEEQQHRSVGHDAELQQGNGRHWRERERE